MNRQLIKHFQKSLVMILFSNIIIGKIKAQDSLPGHSIQFVVGYSKHGSGDMKGVVAGVEYLRYHSKKFFLNYNLRGTINNQKHEIIVNDQATGSSYDASVRFTTAGLQLGVDGGYALIRNKLITLSASLGAFVRYQSASNGTDGYSIYGPAATGLPLILIGYDNQTPQETIAVGGVVQMQVDVNISRHWYIGLVPRYQTDTNGDAIVQYAMTIGRRF